VPDAEGLNVTLTAQLAPAASVAGQVVLEIAKSDAFTPVRVGAPVKFRFALPVLVSTTDWALLVVFTGWLPKSRLAGEGLTTGITAVPVRVTDCVPTLSVMVREPLEVPCAVGTNVTVNVQEAPTARYAGVVGQVLVWAKGELMEMPSIWSAALPLLVSVTVCPEPVAPWVPKLRTLVERLTSGVSPVKPTVCGVPGALSAMLSAASCVPVALGVKVMLMAQLAPAPSEAGQVLVEIANSEAFTPKMLALVILKAALPVFAKTMVWAAVAVPREVPVKVRLVGARLTTGIDAVPESCTGSFGGVAALPNVAVNVPVMEPGAVGTKVTLNVQEAPATRYAGAVGQLFV